MKEIWAGWGGMEEQIFLNNSVQKLKYKGKEDTETNTPYTQCGHQQTYTFFSKNVSAVFFLLLVSVSVSHIQSDVGEKVAALCFLQLQPGEG